MNPGHEISVVIATRNRLHDAMKCIESVLTQTLLPKEIVIVDSSDSLELSSKIQWFESEMTKFIYIHSNSGMTYQWNIGVKASCGDIVFILDDDTILEEEFIKEIMDVFKSDKENKIGGVCGNIISAGQNQRHTLATKFRALAGRMLVNMFFLPRLGSGRFQPSGSPTYRYGTDKIAEVECLPGGATAYRKRVLNEFEFDKNLTYMADDDFSYRESRKYRNVYTPHARIIHTFSLAARRDEYNQMRILIQNYHYLFSKNSLKTIKHRFAFWWSVVGLLVIAIAQGNRQQLRGWEDGLISVRSKDK